MRTEIPKGNPLPTKKSTVIIEKKGADIMSNNQNCKLIYFRKYSDFGFQVEDDFMVRVSENQDGLTEVFVEYCGISRKTETFEQCALSVFREVSSTDWIYRSSGYLIRLYQQRECVNCQNMSEFLEKALKKY